LTIQPGATDDAVTCDLETVSISSLPPYEAVSYTWGTDTIARNEIQLNGKRFATFKNAYDCLVELQHPTAPRAIWIDAICINQKDLEERGHQILLMKNVYEKASRVVVWLAHPRPDAGLVVGLLDELNMPFEDTTKSIETIAQLHQGRLTFPEWVALRVFLSHPWWSRIWTLQETVHGSEVLFQFGNYMIPWRQLLLFDGYHGWLYKALCLDADESLYCERGYPGGWAEISAIRLARKWRKAGGNLSLSFLLTVSGREQRQTLGTVSLAYWR
jgi:hypothetical protein